MNEQIKDFCIDFGLPVLILILLFALLFSGRDGEVKTLLASVIGWIIKSGVSRKKKAGA